MSKYIYVLLTIIFTSYGQLILKWRLTQFYQLPQNILAKFVFLSKVILTDYYILSGFLAAFIAALCWLSAIKKMQLNIAYPLMSLSFVIVFILSTLLFHEKASMLQIIGLLFILVGVSLIGYPIRSA